MADPNVDAEDLRAMLEENLQALAKVENALKSQPDDPPEELLKLKKELEEVIKLSKELVVPNPQQQTALNETPLEHVIERDGARIDGGLRTIPDHSNQFQTIIGRTCVFEAHGSKLYGRIQKLAKREGKGDRVVVQVIGAVSSENPSSAKYMEVDLRAVRLLVPPSVSLLEKGARGQAIWTDDGVWYDCVIVDTFEPNHGGLLRARVKFTDYGNEDVVPIDRIRLFGPSGSGLNSGQKRKIKEITTPGGYKIPEPLQIKATDSEHQKQLKKKKIGLLKKQQRQDTAETEARQRASDWQKHFGAGKPGKAPVLKGRPRLGTSTSSIFSTSSLPEGKVGVTNSGRGMTTFRTRQKHVYEAEGDEEVGDDDGQDEDESEEEDDDDDDDRQPPEEISYKEGEVGEN